MSDLLKKTFKGVFEVGKFIVKGKVLKKEVGARFATNKEQRKIINTRNKGVLVDGKNKRLSSKDSFQHLTIIAKPGGGKTTGYIIPNILDKASQNCSLLITDPSGEIYKRTSKYLKNKGFDIIRLNPNNLEKSACFNPFQGLDANNIIEIEQVCNSIILSKFGNDKDPLWNEGAISILEIFAKCLAYSMPDNLNLPNLNYLIQMFGEDGSALDDWVVENSFNPLDPNDRSIIHSWTGITTSNPRMLSSYVTIAKTALKQINNWQIKQLLFSDDMQLDSFRKRKTAIYLNIPENQQKYYQFLINLFYSKFFSVLMEKEPSKKDLDVYCFLDEFGNAYVDDFQTIVNTIRKYRVSLSLVLQGISQFEEKYGKDKAESIKSGISNYIIYSGADYKTAKEQSDIIGQKVLVQRNDFTDIIERYNQTNLLPADKIRTLKRNQILFMSANRHPFIVDFLPYYENSKFKRLVKKGAYIMPKKRIRQQTKQLYIKNN